MKKFPNSLLVIPTYNCGEHICSVLTKLKDLGIQEYFEEVIVIDNCSKDATLNNALKFYDKNRTNWLKIGVNKSNYGLGGTHKVAVNYSLKYGYSSFAVLHGDDQGDISDLISNVHLVRENIDCSAFLGARFMKNSRLLGYSRVRILGNLVLNLLMSSVTLKKINDMGSGVNLFKVKDLIAINVFTLPDDLTFNNKLILALCQNKKKFIYFPITWSETNQISNAKLLNQALKIITMSVRYVLRLKNSEEKDIYDYEFVVLNA